MRRLLTTLAIGALSLTGACGDSGGSDAEQAVERPGVLVSVYTTPSPLDPPDRTQVPQFELHADGTVLARGEAGFGIDEYRLTEAGVDEARQLFAELPAEQEAYGTLDITDQNSTSLYLGTGEPAEFWIYGLTMITDPEELARDLDQQEVAARQALLDALAAADRLTEQARAGTGGDPRIAAPATPHTPERAELVLRPAISTAPPGVLSDGLSEEPAEEVARAAEQAAVAPVTWPLDTPLPELPLAITASGEPCVALAGGDVVALAEVVERPGLQSRLWSTGAAPGSGAPAQVQVEAHGLVTEADLACDRDREPPDFRSVEPLSPVDLADPAEWTGRFPADEHRPAAIMDLFIAARALMAHLVAEGDGEPPVDPGRYAYDAIVAVDEGVRHLDLLANRVPRSEDQDENEWEARIDLETGAVTELALHPADR